MKKLLIVFLLCLFAFPASAKITVAGTTLEEKHINVLRGHLYDYSKTAGLKNFILSAKTILWINELHEDKKTHEIVTEKNSSDARLSVILSAINFYSQIENGDHEPKLTKANIWLWHEMGKDVIVVHGNNRWEIRRVEKSKK